MLDLNLAKRLQFVVKMADNDKYNYVGDWLVKINKFLTLFEDWTEDILLVQAEFECNWNGLELLITSFSEYKDYVGCLQDFIENLQNGRQYWWK